jgi:dTDP-4-dehydrorhamnose 3,5-epimerase
MPFQFRQLALPGVTVIEPRIYTDERGFFLETFRRSDYLAAGLPESFAQENLSRSVRGTLRGLHFQAAPMAQSKLVRVLAGTIFDVAVDLRADQPTFGQWVGVTLSAADHQMIFVPSWCAHGFCVLSEYADVLYKTTAEYAPEYECGIAWNDETLNIPWPVSDPILSARDQKWPTLHGAIEALQTLGR